jgi:hypothetical protein
VRVVVLGTDAIAIDAPREGEQSIEELLASSPDAAVIAARDEPAFFRASLALERDVRRVIVHPDSMPDAYLGELAARARTLGGEVFTRDDTRYARVAPGPRVEVGAPSRQQPDEPPPDELFSIQCEEVAFAAGLKPVLYLVVPSAELPGVLARYPNAVTREDRMRETPGSGERHYGAGDEHVHVFVGARAREACDLWAADSSRHVEELGALMGYPRCCVRAFAAMANRALNWVFPLVVAARTRALGGRFDRHLDFVTQRLIPFVPCRFDCARAIDWASRVAEEARVTPGGVTVRYDGEELPFT